MGAVGQEADSTVTAMVSAAPMLAAHVGEDRPLLGDDAAAGNGGLILRGAKTKIHHATTA